MRSSITRIDGDDRPFAWHYFSDLEDALDAVQAAELLEIPFVLHRSEEPVPSPDEDSDEVIVSYVVVLLPPGTEFEVASDDDEDDDVDDVDGVDPVDGSEADGNGDEGVDGSA